MRILTVTLFLMFALAGSLFAVGTVVFSENGDNFPAGWTLYHDSGAPDFTKFHVVGFPLDSWYWGISGVTNLSCYSYAEINLNVREYDEVILSMQHFEEYYYETILQYYDSMWQNIVILPDNLSGIIKTDGPYSIPVTVSRFRLKTCPRTHMSGRNILDNLLIVADKRPTLTSSGKAGYGTDGVEPNVALTVDPFIFQIKYTDGDNDAPTYVRLHILNEGVETSSSPFTMNFIEGTYATGALYSTELKFSTGTYTYYFESSDGWLATDTSSEQNRFDVVTVDPPTPPSNLSPKASDGATVASSSVELTWASTVTDNSGITYTVLLSTGTDSYYAPSWAPSVFRTIYTGPATSVTLTSLIPGTLYNWQVEAVNSMGIKTTSPLYSFKTLAKTASVFNYPNPFNPSRQPTFVVYDVDTAQDVKIKIYSEYGSLVFEDTHSALPGSNEYRYDGKDNTGKTLYNGSYVCRIETSKGTRTCYLLIVK